MTDTQKNTEEKGTAYILFLGSINADNCRAFAECISQQVPEGTQKLYILFATGGGNVSFGFALYYLLRALPQTVVMHNIGSVDSIGNIVFLAAEERYAAPHGTFLIHRVTDKEKLEKSETGTLKEKLSTVEGEEKKILEVITSRSRLKKEMLCEFFDNGALKNAQFALDNGIIHDIREFKLPGRSQLLVVKTSE